MKLYYSDDKKQKHQSFSVWVAGDPNFMGYGASTTEAKQDLLDKLLLEEMRITDMIDAAVTATPVKYSSSMEAYANDNK